MSLFFFVWLWPAFLKAMSLDFPTWGLKDRRLPWPIVNVEVCVLGEMEMLWLMQNLLSARKKHHWKHSELKSVLALHPRREQLSHRKGGLPKNHHSQCLQ